MNKVYIQPITDNTESVVRDDGEEQAANVRIRVKNSETLDEFSGTAFLNPQYIDKVQRWVRKNKYSCISLNNDLEMELRVEIFKFNLAK